MAPTSSPWAFYSEVITVECDICYVALEGFASDAMEADELAHREDWAVNIEVKDVHHDHICYSCAEELHYCGHCEKAIWCDDALHCDEAYCSTECLDETHQWWGEQHPGEIECPECEWQNDFAIQDAPTVGEWAIA